MSEQNPLYEKNINQKIKLTEGFCHQLLLSNTQNFQVPDSPGRDIECLPPKLHPDKKGLSQKAGLARLLHDLATIELQAMELGIRTLMEFNNEAPDFKEQLVDIVLDEKKHLQLCLEGIDSLGFTWGDWPTHKVLWQTTSNKDTLLDRLLIVHNFLEGSGLDAGEKIQARLFHCQHKPTLHAVKTIAQEEVGHVRFGTKWYQQNCIKLDLDPEKDFHSRLFSLYKKLPRRLEKLNHESRLKAGFTETNIKSLQEFQNLQRSL